jgi:hypothetical protein
LWSNAIFVVECYFCAERSVCGRALLLSPSATFVVATFVVERSASFVVERYFCRRAQFLSSSVPFVVEHYF